MKKLLEKFEARGYSGVLGFERTKIELAVVEERYEDAAMLRDELRRLEGQQ